MATSFTKLNGFVENLANKEIDLGSGSITIALSNTAPGAEGTPPTGTAAECVLANVTQISYTNCSTRVVTVTSVTQTAGTLKAIYVDLVLTASGGTIGAFRYAYIYDDSSTGDMLIGYYDYGSSVTVQDGDTFTINFSAANGVLTIA